MQYQQCFFFRFRKGEQQSEGLKQMKQELQEPSATFGQGDKWDEQQKRFVCSNGKYSAKVKISSMNPFHVKNVHKKPTLIKFRKRHH